MKNGNAALAKDFLFVVGAPRGGTTWLCRMLADHPQVASVPVELTMFSRYLAVPMANFKRERTAIQEGKWKQGLAVLWSDERFATWAKGLLEDVYAQVLEKNPAATHVLDKHPNYARHMDLIRELVPKAKFVHIIRDGREVAVSMMSVHERIGHSPGEIHEAAECWRDFTLGAMRSGAKLGSDYLEVRYEDLMNKGEETLSNVFHFAGLNDDPALVRDIRSRHDIKVQQVSSGDLSLNALRDIPGAIWRTKLDLQQRLVFERTAGQLLADLGYSAPGWWALSSMDRLRMAAKEPLVRARRALRGAVTGWRQPL